MSKFDPDVKTVKMTDVALTHTCRKLLFQGLLNVLKLSRNVIRPTHGSTIARNLLESDIVLITAKTITHASENASFILLTDPKDVAPLVIISSTNTTLWGGDGIVCVTVMDS